MRWFRFYDDVINDPKVLRLPEATRWQWVAVLCVASKHKGSLPPLEELAFYLRTTTGKVTILLTTLVRAGLLDKTDTGFAPHNWSGRQYVSDGSAERVRRHREKRAAAGLQSQWTAPKALRQAVYDRDGNRCVYCGSSERLSLDHRTPEIRGGTHDIDNLATACLACNGAKRDMTETEYREYVTLLKRSQSTEQKTEQNSEPKGSGSAKADPRDRLFSEGLTKLAELTGKGPDSCRSFAGQCLKVAKDDASVVLGAIDDAHRNRVVDAGAWIMARLRAKPVDRPAEVDWDAVLSAYKKTGHWSRFAGNDPTSPGCRAPPELLHKYGLRTMQ